MYERFQGSIVVSIFPILHNLPYGIVKLFYFIYKCRYNWSNHIKTSCIFVHGWFYSYTIALLSDILTFISTTNGSKVFLV